MRKEEPEWDGKDSLVDIAIGLDSVLFEDESPGPSIKSREKRGYMDPEK